MKKTDITKAKHKTDPVECPNCHKSGDSYETIIDTDPDADETNYTTALELRAGDISFCGNCGQFNEYDQNMKLIKLSDDQLNKIKEAFPAVVGSLTQKFKPEENEPAPSGQ